MICNLARGHDHRRHAERAPHPKNIAIETSTNSQRTECALPRPLWLINPKISPSSNSSLRTPPPLIPDSAQPFARLPHSRAVILLVLPQFLCPHILCAAAIAQLLNVLDLPVSGEVRALRKGLSAIAAHFPVLLATCILLVDGQGFPTRDAVVTKVTIDF